MFTQIVRSSVKASVQSVAECPWAHSHARLGPGVTVGKLNAAFVVGSKTLDSPGSRVRFVESTMLGLVEPQMSGRALGGLLGSHNRTEMFVAVQAPGSELLA